MLKCERTVIVGGAGFIGSHFTDFLLQHSGSAQVTLFDNFSSGRSWHYQHHAQALAEGRLKVIQADVHDAVALRKAMQDQECVIHLASNPDIARAVREPDIDFREGTELTQNVLEAMRVMGVKTLLYASGSGVYGELGEFEAFEDYGPLIPVSTYGASKLAGEALIASYAYMFGMRGVAFRFGNVVGPRQTHGVGFDFIKKLLNNSQELSILGDGQQSKSYVHVSDVVQGVLLAYEKSAVPFQVFNLGTGDYITVQEIAELAIEVLGLSRNAVRLNYSGGDRGWKGDVPIIRLNINRLKALGWTCHHTTREALRKSLESMLVDFKVGRMSTSQPGAAGLTLEEKVAGSPARDS